MFFKILVIFVVLGLCRYAMAKECTNILTNESRNTLQFTLSNFKRIDINYTITDNSANKRTWEIMYQKMKKRPVFNVSNDLLREMSLHDVRLDPNSIHWQAQQTNLKYLLMLDVDSLVWSYRKIAGLPTPGKPYGGWESPDNETRGHFVGWF